jgi:hypothetical protein
MLLVSLSSLRLLENRDADYFGCPYVFWLFQHYLKALELGIAECTTKESEMLSDWRCMRKVARRAVERAFMLLVSLSSLRLLENRDADYFGCPYVFWLFQHGFGSSKSSSRPWSLALPSAPLKSRKCCQIGGVCERSSQTWCVALVRFLSRGRRQHTEVAFAADVLIMPLAHSETTPLSPKRS